MGKGWSWPVHRGVGVGHGLRGDAVCREADTDPSPQNSFDFSLVLDGRNYANLSLPYGVATEGYHTLDSTTPRAVVFAQASVGAMSFDGGKTSMDVGYHGANAFTSCLMNGTHLCGCGWPLDTATAMSQCIRLDADVVRAADNAAGNAAAPSAGAAAITSTTLLGGMVGAALLATMHV